MLTVDLYIRVSTDEQADRGYSQRNQEEQLRKYCEHNQMTIRRVIYEDHSAKTFERPEWKKLLLDLKRYKKQSDLILFTKWDRFSRNAGDAYKMINVLRKLGVEPQAIEQPLDMSVPESKIMLAIYLSAPEVENDRRALNVFHGMRRARKEGRWMGPAPIGYINKSKEDGRKYIAIHEAKAIHVRWLFQELARGQFNTEQVWKMAVERGLKCSKHNFWLAIRNPVYCGKIFVAKFKDEEERLVPGQHEALFRKNSFSRFRTYWTAGEESTARKRKPATNFL
jgi:site-specific DNA recombinase